MLTIAYSDPSIKCLESSEGLQSVPPQMCFGVKD